MIWGVAAWRFGIPTSESHALIAGLTGAGLAASSSGSGIGIDAINWGAWVKVLQGLLISSVLGFVLGFAVASLVVLLFRRVHRRPANRFFGIAQVASAAAMAFSHGTQDGQKFMGVFARAMVFGGVLALGNERRADHPALGDGPVLGRDGRGHLDRRLPDHQDHGHGHGQAGEVPGLCRRDHGVGLAVVAASMGIPVSTTHTKTTAIMGVGVQRGLHCLNLGIVREMIVAWVLTFPVCGVIGFAMTRLFLWIF